MVNESKKINNNRIKGYELLGTTWHHQTREFFDNSTLHGVRYIAEKGRPFCERFMWFCFTSIGAVATLIIIVSLWEKFQTNPTITGLDTDFHNWEVLFPSITVCDKYPNDPKSVEDFINKTWPDSSSDDRQKYIDFLQFVSTLSYARIKEEGPGYALDSKFSKIGEDLRAIVNEVVYKCGDLFEQCYFKAEVELCEDKFNYMFSEVGFCYSFNSRYIEKSWPWVQKKLDTIIEHVIHETDAKWSFSFNTIKNTTQMNIYIHSTDEMPGMDTNPQHLWDRRVEKISFSVKQTYTTSDARQLSIKQRRCVFADEIKLLTDNIYTYSACTRQCRMIQAKQLCGCVPHFYPKIKNFKYCSLVDLRCIAEHADKITNIDKCTCELGCANTVYEVEKLTEQEAKGNGESSNSPLEAEFVSWPMVRYKREVLFGWVDLLVSFGGIAGLFLGFSLLSGVEIIYYFTLRACCMFYSDKEELQRLQVEYSERAVPPYDLSLRPWWGRKPSASLRGPKAVLEEARSEEPKLTSPSQNDIYRAARKKDEIVKPKAKVVIVKEAPPPIYSPQLLYLP